MGNNEKLETWALVEVMGHVKIAGKCTTIQFGGNVMLRVDVPETTQQPAYTKFYGMASVFSITPMSEETAIICASTLNTAPINDWDIKAAINKAVQLEVGALTKQLPTHQDEEDEEDEEEYIF